MVPCILLDLSIDAVVIFHGKRMSLNKASEITRLAMYVRRRNEKRSRKHFAVEKQ